MSVQETILKVLERDLSHAQDEIARAEMQLHRMPFDHDLRNALEQYRRWKLDTEKAIKWTKEH
jgi:hypothetical protein